MLEGLETTGWELAVQAQHNYLAIWLDQGFVVRATSQTK